VTELVGWTQWSPLLGVVGLLVALGLYFYVRGQSSGTDLMRDLSDQIHEGAMAFLRREYTVLAIFVAIVGALLFVAIGLNTSLAYISGALSSVLAGFFGMKAATRANVRTTAAAKESGQGKALRMAFFGGAVMGLSVGALGLVGIGIWYWIFGAGALTGAEFRDFAEVISGYAMGASTIALFARVGGGIYTKAADVGADLVGKVEAGIPEDDPRNPATIADNVGDNVGDVAGMGADIFESYVGSIIATIAIGASSAACTPPTAPRPWRCPSSPSWWGWWRRSWDRPDEGARAGQPGRGAAQRHLHRGRAVPGRHVLRRAWPWASRSSTRSPRAPTPRPARSGRSWPAPWWGSSSGS
jgi:K(+)-stimulated pyrophosphate-energized sodium pump